MKNPSSSIQHEPAATDSVKTSEGRCRAIRIIVLLALIAIATILRVDRANVSLQGDEVLTLKGALLPLYEVLFYRTYPLYYILAHFSLTLGVSEITLRLPSIIAGVLSVPASYFIGREVAGTRAAMLAALLAAISTYNIHFSVVARFYTLVMLAEILLMYFLYRSIVHGGWKNWTAFVLTGLWGAISQLTVVPFFGTMVLGAAAWILSSRSVSGLKSKVILIGVLGFCSLLGTATLLAGMLEHGIPSMLTVESDSSGEADEFVDEPSDSKGHSFDFRLTPSDYAEYLVLFLPRAHPAVQLAFAAFMITGFVALCGRAPAMAWIIGAQFILTPLPFFVARASHWYNDKYFCSLVPVFYILAAAGIAHAADRAGAIMERRGKKHASPAALARRRRLAANSVVAGLVLAYSPFAVGDISTEIRRLASSDWKGMARYVAERVEPGDVIAFTRKARKRTRHLAPEDRVYFKSHPSFEYYFDHYIGMRESAGEPGLKNSLKRVATGTSEDLLNALHRYRKSRVWSVAIRENQMDNEVEDMLKTLAPDENAGFSGGRVRLFDAQ
ncbi:MAG: glycosyltransferase family 39 protein [Candidatus Hydrogenedentes bacterium]|nr:glycosyltransferase family 39 protein [Candidatus Hydrogenedentota bacterium]